MHATTLSSILALALAVPNAVVADEEYLNLTSNFEQYGRPGWYFPFPIPGPGDFLSFNNFSPQYDDGYEDPNTGSVYVANCGPLCAYTIPFAISYNISQEANVGITADRTNNRVKNNVFDVYSFAIGCLTYGVNGTDEDGGKTWGNITSDCTVIANGVTVDGVHVGGSWDYTGGVRAGEGPGNMTLVRAPATFRNLTELLFNGTARYEDDRPYKPVVVIDSVEHGVTLV